MSDQSIILIVDDESVGRDTLEALLITEGYTLAFAANGLEALEKAAAITPDVILLDVMMPGMDGFEVCRQLRADPDLAEVPVIMVTAIDDRDARLAGIAVGADDFLSKPFDRVELQIRIKTITRLNRYRRLHQERTRRQEIEREIDRYNHELLLLKEAERIKDQFVSNVTHELSTPLSTIIFIADNLNNLYTQLSDEKRQKMIRDIQKHAQALHTLIDSILEVSRLDNKRISMERQEIDLVQLTYETTDEQSFLAQKKDQVLHTIGVGPLVVSGHENQLRQVIRNLVNNAVKYTPNKGQITCECALITTTAETKAQNNKDWPEITNLPAGFWAAVRVVDNGPGISQADLPHLFERFYRVENQNNIRGTGLGLSIAKELAELHSGRIAVASTPGQGATFAVYLPLFTQKS